MVALSFPICIGGGGGDPPSGPPLVVAGEGFAFTAPHERVMKNSA